MDATKLPEASLPRGGPFGASAEPLSVSVRRGLLALVIFFHVGGGWALTQVEPVKLIVGDIAPMEVRMVSAEQPQAEPAPEETPPEPPPPDLAKAIEPPPDLQPPPEFPVTELATVIDPPPPDLPPPVFPVEAKPVPPPPPLERPKPPPPKTAPKPVRKKQPPKPAAPVEAAAQPAAPAAPAAPKTVSASQLGYLKAPRPAYPAQSRRSGEQGTVMVRVLVDIAGRPTQVSLQSSSGHAALDASALSAVRAAHFRPYAAGGLAQAVWVLIPIRFVLQ